MAVTSIDPDVEYWNIVNREFGRRERRTRQPVVRLWDGNYVLRGRATHIIRADFKEIEWDVGMGTLEMPEEYYLSRWIAGHDDRDTSNVHITVEKDGVRWSGRMDRYEAETDKNGLTIVRAIFKHDFAELRSILCWANPFLPAEMQFPKVFLLFGNAKFCLKAALFCNILRLENNLWSLPDNLLDPDEWNDYLSPLDQSEWTIAVKPDMGPDASPLAIFYSRFKTFADAAKDIGQDAQLTPVFRRFLTGDEPPWPGANLRHGCLVVDFEDNSGWTTGTSFEGSLFTGLVHALVNIGSDGLTEGIDIIDDPIVHPPEYFEPGWLGTLPQAPGIVYRHQEGGAIQASTFTGIPAKELQHVTGGHSMPGVNEMISAAIQMAGDLIAAMIGVPPVGGAADAILKPLYTDVFLAFMHWKDLGRKARTGDFAYQERWAEGSDRAYTLSALIALRTSIWATREQFTHRLEVSDGAPWLIGQRGFGHFYLGHRIGSCPKGTPKGKIYVDRVTEIGLSWDRQTTPTWSIVIGEREFEDPVLKALKKIREIAQIARDLGVL